MLLAGGDSSERTVSLESGEAIYETLNRLGHVVYVIDPSTGKSLLTRNGSFVEYKAKNSHKAPVSTKSSLWPLSYALGSAGFRDIDLVFISLHGGAGENGTLQCLLELAGKKYTGSSMSASAIAMDKAIAKRLCASENISTPDWGLYQLSHNQVDDRLCEEITNRFTFPIIVKPNDSGSTIGLSKVCHQGELHGALQVALKESSNILVERYISGREITAAVLDGKALPLVEIKPKNELYDYEAKYTKGKSKYFVPADIKESAGRAIQQAAVRIYKVIGASGLARVDVILDENEGFYFLELNTLPGMTQLSLAPMAAAAAGIDFDNLISRLIEVALNR